MTTVFLSHSGRDDSLAEELTKWLSSNGFTDVFVDHVKIRVGDRWTDALRNAKASCRIVLCLVTESWLESDECYSECLAGWYAGKRIMPLLAIRGTALNKQQQHRLSRILAEDQGFDLTIVGAPQDLAFDKHPGITANLIAGLKAGGASTKIGLDPFAFEADVKLRPDPFPGLASFGDEEADAAIFFGRSPEIATCIEDLREMRASGDRRAYTILGASGSGKSSLMKAGVLPRLRRERGWLVMRSFRPGADPLYSFAESIARTAAGLQINWAPGSIHEELLSAWRGAQQARPGDGEPSSAGPVSDDPTKAIVPFNTAIIDAVERRIRPLRDRAEKPAATCLIAIDQAEELARGREESGVALGHIIAALSTVASGEGAPIPYSFVLTVRDDAFSELRSSKIFAQILTRTADIRALPLYRFAHAIEQPAERYGVVMEPTLVQAMVEDAPETDALPLLAFALRRLWTRFALERRISRSNYELFGKLPGLIEDAAERALRGMDPRDDSPLTPARVSMEREKRVMGVFIPALAQFNERGHVIRRLAPLEAFTEEDKELLSPFSSWRLLTSRGKTIEVSHEAMFREWPRFTEWLKPERERLDALRGAEAAAETWDSQSRKPEYLTHRGRRLSAAQALWEIPDYRRQMEAAGHLKAYLYACRWGERKRSISVAAIVLLLAITGLTLVATNTRTIGAFLESAANVQAALPGASFANAQIRTEYNIRRSLLRSVLDRYMKYALEGINPKASGEKNEPAALAAALLMSTRAGTATNDPWSIGQIAAALDQNTVPTSTLQAYFDTTFIHECACWSPIDGDQHAAATGWILLGQANQGVQIRLDVINGILIHQSDDGGWPLFFEAQRIPESNSTYATAILLLVLHELSSKQSFDRELNSRIGEAIHRARDWLHEKAPKDGQYWTDYPDSLGRKVSSRGNSAFVTFVLLATGDDSEDQRIYKSWFANIGSPVGLEQLDNSDQFVRLTGDRVRRDGTRYPILSWELAAIGKGARHLGGLEKIRARRFFLNALQAWPVDQTGRFDFLTADMLIALNTILGDADWSRNF